MAGATGQRNSQLNGIIPFPPKEDFAIASYLVPDSVSRVFHPQQVGHALIANLNMYTMASQQAISMGMQPPPQELKNIGSSCPMAPSPACSGSSSHTWFSRDAAISSISSFCQNYANVAGTAGKSLLRLSIRTVLTISIAWHEDLSLGENQCNNWFDIVVNGCDTSTTTSKHGGSIGFASNVTLSIDSLVMQRLWDGGRFLPLIAMASMTSIISRSLPSPLTSKITVQPPPRNVSSTLARLSVKTIVRAHQITLR